MQRLTQAMRRTAICGVTLSVILLLPGLASADPVEDLRQALPLDDVSNPTEGMLKFRRSNLQQRVDALKTVGQLRRALALDEWRDDPTRVPDIRISRIDTEMRSEVGRRLTTWLTDQSQSDVDDNRLAVANLVAEIGPTIRALNPGDRGGFARSLLPIVQPLTKDQSLAVRQEALRAIGNIFASPKVVAPILKAALANETAAGPRRVAADALGQLIRVVVALNRFNQTAPVFASRTDVFDAFQHVLEGSAAGFTDSDAQVRTLSADAVQLAVQALTDLKLFTEVQPRKFAPVGRPRTAEEENEYAKAKNDLAREIEEIKPVLAAIRTQANALAPLLADSDASVRHSAIQALVNMALVRQHLRERALGLPNYDGPTTAHLALVQGADPLGEFLPNHLDEVAPLARAQETRIRRSTAIFLMLIEDQAASQAATLYGLLADPDRSIRWIAVKALAFLPTENVVPAVPAMARLLSDPDLMIRIATAKTLANLGHEARGATAALAQAVTIGDSEARNAALEAIRNLAPTDAQATLPQLIEALGQRDAEPKVLIGVAGTLAHLGSSAASATPSLRRLIGHEDPEVRIAASEAILAIHGTGKR